MNESNVTPLEPRQPPRQRLSIIAVLTGAVVDVLGTVVLIAIVGMMISARLHEAGYRDEELQSQLLQTVSTMPWLGILLALGLVMDYVAGYVAARMAGYLEVWHGFAAILFVLVCAQILSGGHFNTWTIVSSLAGMTAAVMGALRYKKRKARSLH